jgi:hypothetical protein
MTPVTEVSMTEMLSVQELLSDPRIGGGSHLDQERVDRYATILDQLPPIVMFRTEDGLILADGYHRVAAARKAGAERIAAEVRNGSRGDALRFAVTKGAEERGLSEDEVMASVMRRRGQERA